jgi:hypothetical protein
MRAAAALSKTLLAIAAAGCISNNPPAPPPRWFDPTPAPAPAVANPSNLALGAPAVSAAPHLGEAFALRTGEREFVFDDQHRWVATPDRLVAAVLEQRLFGTARWRRGGLGGWAVRVLRFELDLTGVPTAVVELRVANGSEPERVCSGRAEAASREPAAVATAMAAALAAACDQAVAAGS